MKVRIVQLLVSPNIEENKSKIIKEIKNSESGEWVIFPEGILSGYYPEDDNYLSKLDWDKISSSIEEIENLVKQKNIRCIFGTAYKDNERWYNAAVFVNRDNKYIYKKVNLSTLDRKCFTAGDSLDVYDVELKFGIQICRDNAFPEQWRVLKEKGAQVVFHINNAIQENDTKRKPLLMARAFENQFYVVSVNNASSPQTLPSLAISPFGDFLYESQPQQESVNLVELDLSKTRDDYLKQSRSDIVEVVYKK